MQTEIELKDAVGKVLKDVLFASNQAVITFTDDTFTTLGVGLGYEPGEETIRPDTLELFDFGDDLLANAGIATKEELNDLREERRKKAAEHWRVTQEEREREEFERLKKKFGNE